AREPARDVAFYLVDQGTALGPAMLSIVLQSARAFSCAGYSLSVSARVTGQTIDIRIGAVRPRRGPCLTAVAPARGEAPIGTLSAARVGSTKTDVATRRRRSSSCGRSYRADSVIPSAAW